MTTKHCNEWAEHLWRDVWCVCFHSPSVVLVSAIGSLVLLLALAVYRHQHPVNLYLLFGFVSVHVHCFESHNHSTDKKTILNWFSDVIYPTTVILSITVLLQTLLEAVSVATAGKLCLLFLLSWIQSRLKGHACRHSTSTGPTLRTHSLNALTPWWGWIMN